MTEPKREPKQDLPAAWWAMNLDELDREIVRLALLCRVSILDPGVVERVLKKDASVCGNDNAVAFAKLHDMVMLHLASAKSRPLRSGKRQRPQSRSRSSID